MKLLEIKIQDAELKINTLNGINARLHTTEEKSINLQTVRETSKVKHRKKYWTRKQRKY